ncbi:MAG TPA: SDR family oxidoreductase [Patescibacteria group bacterium]|nr:SDR family oxidoreductase [Patescibacteria group bacterium]
MSREGGTAIRLQDSVALVTGAAVGIGQGIAREFVREGAAVVLADIDHVAGQAAERDLRELGGRAIFVHCDVSQEDAVIRAIETAVGNFGGLDTLVNNAAVGVYRSVAEASVEEFDRALAVNLRGPFLGIKHAAPHLARSRNGSIINIASVHSVQNVGGTAPYAASKGGLIALTRAAAIDLAKDGIRVNAICPGWVDTPLIRGIFAGSADPGAARRQVERRQLLGRLGRPEEIGRVAVFLASTDASYMTGSMLFVDNGMTAQLETWSE